MKNTKRIIATVLTAIMMISMLPSSVFAADLDVYDVVEPAVEAVSVPAEEQEIESTVEDVSVEDAEIAEGISVEDAETVQGSSEEFETVEAADPAAADEIEDADAPVVDDKITLKAEGKDYVVTVTYDASALLPDDVKVTAEEIKANAKKYDDYCDQALEAVQQENADVEELSYARLFDIKLVDAAGNVLEPASAVDVQIRFKDVEAVEESTQIVHFAGEEEIPEVIEPTVENDTVAFATEGFSIYAVIGTGDYKRLTVNFYNGDEIIDTMYVKKSDQEDDEVLAQIIYDPGAGTIPNGYAFYGWSIGEADYSAAEPGSSIEDVRTHIKGLEFDDGDVLNVYAMLVTYYTVKYIDGEGLNLGTHTARVKEAGEEVEYTVNMNYTTDSEHNFEGWLVHDGINNITDPADATTTTLFANETKIKITGDVEFSVSAPEGHWLIFDENGKHATYNAPRFVKSGEVTSNADMLDMVRKGYSFGGWYTGAPSTQGGDPTGQEFKFGYEIDQTTTIYAKWIPATKADYTVIIWKEGLTEGAWDFEESIVINGDVGTAVNTVQTTGSGDNRYARINNVPKQYKGFSYDHHDTNVIINAEGNTLVNVYYKRNTYTLSFWVTGYITGWPIRELEPITAKYGYDISSHFPMKASLLDWPSWFDVGSVVSQYVRWNARTHETFTQPVVYIDTMPAENITFDSDRSGVDPKAMYYYIEALPGEQVARSYNGKDFVLYEGPLYARYNYFTESEDFMNIAGTEKWGSEPGFDSDGRAYGDTLRCYYTRETKYINFKDGAYFDGNDVRTGFGNEVLGKSDPIPFNSDITSYNKGKNKYFEPECPEVGYVLEGWYVDQACTYPYTFNRMSSSDITVYAKWRQIQYRVFLRPNAGTDQTLFWGSDTQATNFRVSYGDKVSAPEGTRRGYKFLGWFKDKDLTIPAYTRNIVMNEVTVTDEYDKSLPENMTNPWDKWGTYGTSNDDVDRFWVTKRFELFAKWGKVIEGADGIGILYDITPDGIAPAPTDDLLYQDNTTAVAAAAPRVQAGKVFKNWVVQHWDGSGFVDGEPVLPGQTFDVLVDNARIQDPDGNVVTIDEVVEGATGYTYTIRVRAEYGNVEEETPTHITWYKNDGSGEIYRNDTEGANGQLKINEAVTIYGLGEGESIPERDGYTFLGWTKAYESEGSSIDADAADFLRYNADDVTFTDVESGETVTEVAADEITPYEALYAVWEEKPHFTIYHSSNGDREVIDYEEGMKDFNLAEYTLDGYLYGGYYEYDEESSDHKGAVITSEPGIAMTPAQGATYYLQEVSDNYIRPYLYKIYRDNATPKVIHDLYLMTAVYDGDQEDGIKNAGFIIDDQGDESEITETTIGEKVQVTKNGTVTAEIKSTNVCGGAGLSGNVVSANIKKYYDRQSGSIIVRAFYITADHVKVLGNRINTISFAGEADQFGETWLTKDTLKTAPSVSESGPEYTDGTSYRKASSPRKTVLINASKALSITVTKIDNGKKVAQSVNSGNNTGKITYSGKTNYVFAGWYEDAAYTKVADFSNVKGDMTVYAKYVKASDVKLSFTKKSVKSGNVTLKATLKINNQPDAADAAVECSYNDKAYAVEFTGVKTSKSVNTYTGAVTIDGLANGSAFAAVISYKTPDGTIVSLGSKTCKYNAGLVTVK